MDLDFKDQTWGAPPAPSIQVDLAESHGLEELDQATL